MQNNSSMGPLVLPQQTEDSKTSSNFDKTTKNNADIISSNNNFSNNSQNKENSHTVKILSPLLTTPYFNTCYEKSVKNNQWKLSSKLVGLANPYQTYFNIFLTLSPYSKIITLTQQASKKYRDDKNSIQKNINELKIKKQQIMKEISQNSHQKQNKQSQIIQSQVNDKSQGKQDTNNKRKYKEKIEIDQQLLILQQNIKLYDSILMNQQLISLQNIAKFIKQTQQCPSSEKLDKIKYSYCPQYLFFLNKALKYVENQKGIQNIKKNENKAQQNIMIQELLISMFFGEQYLILRQIPNFEKIFNIHIKHAVYLITGILSKKPKSFESIQKLEYEVGKLEQFKQFVKKVQYQQILTNLYISLYQIQLNSSQVANIKRQIQQNLNKISFLSSSEKKKNIEEFVNSLKKSKILYNSQQYPYTSQIRQHVKVKTYQQLFQKFKKRTVTYDLYGQYPTQHQNGQNITNLQCQMYVKTNKNSFIEKMQNKIIQNLVNIVLNLMSSHIKNKFQIILKPQDFIFCTDTGNYNLNILAFIPYLIGLQNHPYTIQQQLTYFTPHQYDYYDLIKNIIRQQSKECVFGFTLQHLFTVFFMMLLLKFGQQNPFKSDKKQTSINQDVLGDGSVKQGNSQNTQNNNKKQQNEQNKDIKTNITELVVFFKEEMMQINSGEFSKNQHKIKSSKQQKQQQKQDLYKLARKTIDIIKRSFQPSKTIHVLRKLKIPQHLKHDIKFQQQAQTVFSHQMSKIILKNKKLQLIYRQIEILKMIQMIPSISVNVANPQIKMQTHYVYLLIKQINDLFLLSRVFFQEKSEQKNHLLQQLQQFNVKIKQIPHQNQFVVSHLNNIFQSKIQFLQGCFTKIDQALAFEMQKQLLKQIETKPEQLNKGKMHKLDQLIIRTSQKQLQKQLFRDSQLIGLKLNGNNLYFRKSSHEVLKEIQSLKRQNNIKYEIKKNVLVNVFLTLTNFKSFELIQKQICLPIILHEQTKTKNKNKDKDKNNEQFYQQIQEVIKKIVGKTDCKHNFQTRRDQLNHLQRINDYLTQRISDIEIQKWI